MIDRLFRPGDSVRGMSLFEFLKWAEKSQAILSGHGEPIDPLTSRYGVLALPPVQRTAVWKPTQVVDLWDSMFRGLPIGSFYLVERSGKDNTPRRGLRSDDRTTSCQDDGLDLLDGQQRLRALLLGLLGPKIENRCLWLDLGAEAKSHYVQMYLTSASQPFGYQPETGQKWQPTDRKKAREALESDPRYKALPKLYDKDGCERPIYDYELFGLYYSSAEHGSAEPTRPYKASDLTCTLHSLLTAWRVGEHAGDGLKALKQVVQSRGSYDAHIGERLDRLDMAFRHIAEMQVALLKIDPKTFLGKGAGEPADYGLLLLFDRIGAGGTPLTAEERLFSIYKHHEPRIHDLIMGPEGIYTSVGRVLDPTKIVAAALRIANARTHKDDPHLGNAVPDVATFAREMAVAPGSTSGDGRTKTSLRNELEYLLLPSNQSSGGKGALVACFNDLFKLLRYHEKHNRLGFPKVMQTTLPPQLVQILLLWVLRARERGEEADSARCREEAIRFAMFWRLCVTNEDRASTRCFEVLRSSDLPTAEILHATYDALREQDYVWILPTPEAMEQAHRGEAASPAWRPEISRFDKAKTGTADVFRAWWGSRDTFLVWLQRDYIEKKFPNFDPTSGREDDVPYDVDHMCPYSDWGRNWTTFWGLLRRAECLTDDELNLMRDARFVLGNAIGNFRLIDAGENRSDGADDILAKMSFVRFGSEPPVGEQDDMVKINTVHLSVWSLYIAGWVFWDRQRWRVFLLAFRPAFVSATTSASA